MAKKYLIAFISIAILAVTVQIVSSNAELANPVQDLIEVLLKNIKNLVNTGIKQFRDALEAISKTVKGIVDGFSKAASVILGPIADEINKISNQAISSGINITECAVDETLEEIADLPAIFLGQLNQCLDTVMEEANQSMADGEKELDNIVDEVQDLVDQAGKCTLIDFSCWNKLATKVAEYTTKIPVQVAEAITTTLKLLTSLGKSALQCKIDTMTKLTEEANNLMKNVTECIEYKMHSSTFSDEFDC